MSTFIHVLTPSLPSDSIARNVLRSVALSTNSVAASVGPVIQQQLLALSPSPSQFPTSLGTHLGSGLDSQGMAHTPIASSMLSALNDLYNTQSLEGGFHNSSYDPLSFTSMDTSTSQGDHLINSLLSNQSYHDYGTPWNQSFDFSHYINLDPPPVSSESLRMPKHAVGELGPEHSSEPVKAETSP